MKKNEYAAGCGDGKETVCENRSEAAKKQNVDEDISQYIGPRIKELLKKYHLTKYRLAQLSGVLSINLTRYVKGARTPSLQTLARICAGFGITLSEFFENAPYQENPDLPDEQNRLLELWDGLDEEGKRQMLSYGRFLLYTQNKEA